MKFVHEELEKTNINWSCDKNIGVDSLQSERRIVLEFINTFDAYVNA